MDGESEEGAFDEGRKAEWLGHADPAFTLRTYVHLLDAGVGGGLDLPNRGNTMSATAANAATVDTPETAA